MSQTPESCDGAAYEEALNRVIIGGALPLERRVEIADYDPAWPHLFAQEAARLRSLLGDRVRLLEHLGSTSVPGLAAKPVIDMVLEVHDSADEPAYAPDLEAAGYVLRIRELEFFEHRLFKGPGADINLHVFSDGCEETRRMLVFCDRLRAHQDERDLYARLKRELAARDWKYTQQYADAKTAVIAKILDRAGRSPSRPR
jgi:GrpB-like predicted nucleotidyltransferase (UPF0157 family)